MVLSDASFAELVIKLRNGDATLSKIEEEQAESLAYRLLNVWTEQEIAFRNGLLTADQFSLTKDDVLNAISRFPALQHYWAAALRDYPAFNNYDALKPISELSAE